MLRLKRSKAGRLRVAQRTALKLCLMKREGLGGEVIDCDRESSRRGVCGRCHRALLSATKEMDPKERAEYEEPFILEGLLLEWKEQSYAGKALIRPGRPKKKPAKQPETQPLALDVSLEKARALHRVWRALNDGDCPNCHTFHAATEIRRSEKGIQCPACLFDISMEQIADIEKMFAPAMDAAVAIFHEWVEERRRAGQA